MLYPDCERAGGNVQMSQAAHQHLNLLSSHLNQADYLATAAMALSPKYNTAFNVTSLLNPVLEESYRKQQEAYHHHHQQQQQQHQFKSEPLAQQSRASNNMSGGSTGSASTPSSLSSSSSSSSVKHPSPINATASASSSSSVTSNQQPSATAAASSSSSYQTSTTPTSSASSSSFSSASLIVPSPSLPGAGTALSAAAPSSNNTNIPSYFNYQSSSNQFNQSNLMGSNVAAAQHLAAAAHHSAHHQMQHNPAHYHPHAGHYGLPPVAAAYPSPYGGSSHHHGMHASINSNGSSSASSVSSTDTESMGYVHQQLQYSNPGSWYANPNDSRFASNYHFSCFTFALQIIKY
jgi:hypothetical protein